MLEFKLPLSGKWFAVSTAVAVAAFSLPAFAQSDCPPFPKITFWGEMTHASVRQHVEDKLAGNWVSYLNQLQRQQTTLTKIHLRDSGAVIKRKGKKIRLAGEQLGKYLKFSQRRISVVQCLAEMEEATGLADFATAAGTPSKAPVKKKASKSFRSGGEAMDRTFITLPKSLLVKLRKKAVRKSLKTTKRVTVNEIIVEILKQGTRKRNR